VQYLLLIYETETTGAERTETEQAQYIDEFRSFTQDIIASGKFKAGEALAPVSNATSVRVRSGEVLLTDGPFAETREQLGGFYLVDAANLDDALAIAAKIPTAKYGTIEVRPLFNWTP
jgi:hypothetical protein